ncbi:hypothetical protein [Cohnella herbarum]|uniref:Uncharacterized protein n=1 Tax=Cohnella herbarum TaxID=2728023 RepID=A0A7Z2VG77_9BACL|nr:hypothetical protein [Cohnella herbarum]QJD82623.1 hypothetical protein HH215_05075 [Cohnella herbarum]
MFNHYQDLRDLSEQRHAEWERLIQEQSDRQQWESEHRYNRGAPLRGLSKILPSNWFNRIDRNQSANAKEGNSRCPATLPNH